MMKRGKKRTLEKRKHGRRKITAQSALGVLNAVESLVFFPERF
jgi:hypothetical protein